MAERLIEIYVPGAHAERVGEIVEKADCMWSWKQSIEDTAVIRLLVKVEAVEPVLDKLEPLLNSLEGSRLLVLTVEAFLPRPEPEPKPVPEPGTKKPIAGRISRSELYADLEGFAKITPSFLITSVLSTIVAVIGLTQNSSAVIIGAMVIAPLLGPNMALALATTLGDTGLMWRALKANAAGVAVALAVALLSGLVWTMDPSANEVASRTIISFNEILLALATGTAGALAVTIGVASSLVGVMVAVALLPPLVIASTLLVQGHVDLAANAFLLLATNVICVNLSGVVTFYAQGIKPRTWWESQKSKRATRVALTIWLVLLAIVAVLVSMSTFEGLE